MEIFGVRIGKTVVGGVLFAACHYLKTKYPDIMDPALIELVQTIGALLGLVGASDKADKVIAAKRGVHEPPTRLNNSGSASIGVLVMVLAACIMVSGCLRVTSKKPWCEQVPAGETSVICSIADYYGTTPEAVSKILEISNLGALATDPSLAYDIDSFLVRLRSAVAMMDNPTYDDVVNLFTDKYTEADPRIQALMIILGDYKDVEIEGLEMAILPAYDVAGIIGEIDKLMLITKPFLVVN